MHERRPQWPMFRAVGSRAEMLDYMLDALSINRRVAVVLRSGTAFLEALATCIGCTSNRECRRWLDGRGEGARAAIEPPVFCPNAIFLRACRDAVTVGRPSRGE